MSISRECDRYGQHEDCDGRHCRCGCHPRTKSIIPDDDGPMVEMRGATWHPWQDGEDS